jgi:hypothetical protein
VEVLKHFFKNSTHKQKRLVIEQTFGQSNIYSLVVVITGEKIESTRGIAQRTLDLTPFVQPLRNHIYQIELRHFSDDEILIVPKQFLCIF